MLRFQKRLNLLPGVRLNISKSGVSTSLGPRGASINVGRRGIYGNIGVPGTGLSYRQRLDGKTKPRRDARTPQALSPDPEMEEQELSEEKKRHARERVAVAQDMLSDFGSRNGWLGLADLSHPLPTFVDGRLGHTPSAKPAMLDRGAYLLRLAGLALLLGALSLNFDEIEARLKVIDPGLPGVLAGVVALGAILLFGVWTVRRTRHIGLSWWLGFVLLPLGFVFHPFVGLICLAALCLIPGKN